MGDFNRLDTSSFRNAFKLKQVVKFHTGGNQTLDLVLTNIKEFYKEPIKRPAFGLSDHVSVELQPLSYKRPAGKLQGHSELILGKSQHHWPCKEQRYM